MIESANRRLRKVSALALALLSSAAAVPAFAQSTDAPAAGSNDIIVTANKREENLQDVPLAVTVVSGDVLATSSGSGLDALQIAVPTLTLRRGTTVANSAIVLRGVGTISFSLAAEPAVSTVIDGVVYARSGQAFSDLFDVDRIEVLRGPQGTLFGKNASAGALNIVTRAPSRDFQGEASVSIFSGEEYRARATISGPLSDSIRARLSGSYGSYDGNIRNVFTNQDVNGYERWGVRGVIDFDVSPSFRLRLIGDYSQNDDDCCAEAIGSMPSGALAAATLATLGTAVPAGDDTRRVNHNLTSRTIGRTGGVSLQGDLEVGDHTITSITAWRSWRTREIREGDFLSGGANYVGINQLHDDGTQDYQQFSQELRLTSPTGGLLEYQFGVFYFDVDGSQVFTRSDIVCGASTLAIDATGSRPCTPAASTLTFPAAQSNAVVDLENIAIFGQATLNLARNFRLIAGGRYTRDEVSFAQTRVNLVGAGGPGISATPFPPAGTPGGSRTTETNFSVRLGAQYDFSDNIMGYVTYAQGYKGPAFNVFFNMGPTDILPIAAETADSFELGLKLTTADRRLTVNLAAFNAEYQNFQANSFRTIAGAVVTNLTNAGTIRTRGFEADFILRPNNLLTVSGGFAYADAIILSFTCPPPGPGVPACDSRRGERLPLAPEFKVAINVDQRIPIAGAPFDMAFGAQVTHTDEQYSSLRPAATPFATFREERIRPYTLANASLSFMSKDERFTLTLSVNNIFDESFAALKTPGGPAGAYRYIIPREADRHYGATFRARF